MHRYIDFNMIKCLITVNFALFPTRDFFQIILLYWKVLLPSLLYKLLLCALASCNRLWWAHFQMQYINHVDKPFFLSSSFFLLPQIFFFSFQMYCKANLCFTNISSDNTLLYLVGNESPRTELLSGLRSSRCSWSRQSGYKASKRLNLLNSRKFSFRRM